MHNKSAELITHIADLAEDETLALVHQRLADGDDPLDIIKDAQQGMRLVGKRYEEGQYYIAGLIMAGEIFQQVTDLTLPLMEAQLKGMNASLMLLAIAGIRDTMWAITKILQGVLY